MPSGIAVAASPKLWIRSASRATLPVPMKIATCARAVAPRIANARAAARRPARERLIEGSIRLWLCHGSLGVSVFVRHMNSYAYTIRFA